MRKARRIIKGAQSRHQRAGYKFGIKLPKNGNISGAMRLDRENGDNQWMDALRKEISAVMVAFQVQPEGTTRIPGYKPITGHVVWSPL
jgi:hypothetical protein